MMINKIKYKYEKSWLYAPAYLEDFIIKGKHCNVDCLIFDLEDAVKDSDKERARLALPLSTHECGGMSIAIRLNEFSSIHFYRDIVFLFEHNIQVDYLIIPKAESIEMLLHLRKALHKCCPNFKFMLLIETAEGLELLKRTKNLPECVHGILLGTSDMNASLGFHPIYSDLSWLYREVAYHGRRLNVEVCDAPCMHIRDLDILNSQIQRAKKFGFTGKQAIHPSQISSINSAFSISDTEVNYLRSYKSTENHCIGVTDKNDTIFGPPTIRYLEKLKGNVS